MTRTSSPATSTDTSTAAVITVIHATAEAWNTQDFSKVLELWDPAEPVPFYLAEEQDDWSIGAGAAEKLSGTGPAQPGKSRASARRCATSR